jgi:hypothetical protein
MRQVPLFRVQILYRVVPGLNGLKNDHERFLGGVSCKSTQHNRSGTPAGTRSRAMTATAPASSAMRASSTLVTSMITPPFSICARPTCRTWGKQQMTKCIKTFPFASLSNVAVYTLDHSLSALTCVCCQASRSIGSEAC